MARSTAASFISFTSVPFKAFEHPGELISQDGAERGKRAHLQLADGRLAAMGKGRRLRGGPAFQDAESQHGSLIGAEPVERGQQSRATVALDGQAVRAGAGRWPLGERAGTAFAGPTRHLSRARLAAMRSR